MSPFEAGKRFYYGKNVACLMSVENGQRVALCDILVPGNYDFGLAKESITMAVTSGALLNNRNVYFPNGDPLKFATNQLIYFYCDRPTTCRIIYG
jgi:uncharacterized protein YaiE (UPF0345 family)